MKADSLFKWIDSLSQDIDFEYKGITGSICPFARDNISLSYDGYEVTVGSVDAAMKQPFISGKSLKDICETLNI